MSRRHPLYWTEGVGEHDSRANVVMAAHVEMLLDHARETAIRFAGDVSYGPDSWPTVGEDQPTLNPTQEISSDDQE